MQPFIPSAEDGWVFWLKRITSDQLFTRLIEFQDDRVDCFNNLWVWGFKIHPHYEVPAGAMAKYSMGIF